MWPFKKQGADRSGWEEIIRDCDLLQARDEIADLFQILNSQAEERGGRYAFRVEMVEAWRQFSANPCADTAIDLLQTAPELARYFEVCRRGGGGYPQDAHVRLAAVIVAAALRCAEAVKPHLDDATERERTERWIYVAFEFTYFFMHLTDRTAHAFLSPSTRDALVDQLGPSIVTPLVRTLFGHWPKESQRDITSEFYERVNEAQMDYSACKEVLSKDVYTGDALVSKLARKVAELAGHPMNPVTMTLVMEACVNELNGMNLKQLVEDAARLISQP
jgi:hypothetical protein